MKKLYFLLILIFGVGCQSSDLPKNRYYQFYSNSNVSIKNDTLICSLNNPLDCPLRFYIITSDSFLNKSLTNLNPCILPSRKDTLFKIKLKGINQDKIKTFWRSGLGDPNVVINKKLISLPFCKGKSYKIIQGYNGEFSHNVDYSRYAIDFSLKSNDTICAADEGYVVGVIKDYNAWGTDKRYKDFANFITLYHPHSGLYTQYVHLKYNGSFLKVGDFVKQGQAIGLTGLTGWTSIVHLHFNVLIPSANNDGFTSTPIEFIENYRGCDLKESMTVKK